MSELIPSIDFEEMVRIARAGKISDLQACEVKIDGRHCFTALIFHGDMFASGYIQTQAEYLGVKANIIGGKTPAEVLASLLPELTPEQALYDQRVARMAHAREARKAKKELVKV